GRSSQPLWCSRITLHFTWLVLAICVHAGSLSLQNPRFTIASSTAAQLRTDILSLAAKPEPLKLGPTDKLKLTFQITEKSEGKGVQPHQTFLRFYDSVSGEEGIQPIQVTPGGKAKFELNMARPPASLPPTTDHPLEVSVILGSFWSKIGVRVPHLFSPRIIPFTALLYWYWVDLKLGQVLLYGGILAVPTIFAGKTALAATGEWRTRKN
ncbi:hypothetical protein EDC04DRAFT_2673279, partial [Pisolithus marmoratus]